MQQLIDLQQQVFEANKAKGFWKDAENRDKEEAVALMIGELYESLEGHRKGRDASMNLLSLYDDTSINDVYILVNADLILLTDLHYSSFIETHIKDTWQDELADAVIRLLDYTGGFGITLIADDGSAVGQALPKNFGAAILHIDWRIQHVIMSKEESWRTRGWSYVLHEIVDLARREGCNLYQHVIWKLKYNTMREHLHGKKY